LVTPDDLYAELAHRQRADGSFDFGESELHRWGGEMGISPTQLLDLVAEHLAMGFDQGRLTWHYCDDLINEFWGLPLELDLVRSPLFVAVYDAFDDGEHHHRRGDDPVEEYTRPQIAGIVSKLSQRR
jgi:hypothetical protein